MIGPVTPFDVDAAATLTGIKRSRTSVTTFCQTEGKMTAVRYYGGDVPTQVYDLAAEVTDRCVSLIMSS